MMIDIHTLLLITPIISLTLSAFFVFLSFENTRVNIGIRIISVSYLLAAVANVFILVRVSMPVLSYTVSNLFGLASMYLYFLGVSEYLHNEKRKIRSDMAFTSVVLFTIFFFIFVYDVYYIRAVLWSFYMVVFLFQAFRVIRVKQCNDIERRHYYPVLGVIFFYILSNLYRIVATLSHRGYITFESQNVLESVAIAASVYFHIALGLALTIIIHRQNVRVLEEANDETRRRYDEALHVSNLDFLTGVYNRKKLDQTTEDFVKQTKKENKPFTALFIDIDDFKMINDTFGHLIGDKVLQNVAGVLKRNFKYPDVSGRWGGDEFLILLPNSDISYAEEKRALLKSKVSGQKIKGHQLSLSIGIAEFKKGDKLADFLTELDRDLYKNKKDR